MTESEYLATIRDAIPNYREIPPSLMDTVEQAVRDFPNSSELWCLRGDMIQLSADDCPHELKDALASYTRALEADSKCAEAYESIGYYYDTFTDDLEAAETAFRKAVELNAGLDSHIGFARVLAQRGNDAAAVRVLDCCPAPEDEEVLSLREEIENGVWSP